MHHKKVILVDFDGTLHSYKSGWSYEFNAKVVLDEPTEGAIEWLREMLKDPELSINILSARNHQEGGIDAMKFWLERFGLSSEEIAKIGFPLHKIPFWMIIDDRGFCFTGKFPTASEIKKFTSWIDKE